MDTLFTKGAVIGLANNTKAVVIDSYSIDAKSIRIIALTEALDICVLNFNLDTDRFYNEHYYDTVRLAAELRQY